MTCVCDNLLPPKQKGPRHLAGGFGVVPGADEVPAVQARPPVLVLVGVLHVAGVFGEHVFPPAAQDHLRKGGGGGNSNDLQNLGLFDNI